MAASVNGAPVVDGLGRVRFAFEGNANRAVNLERYYEKVQCAAGRLANRSPSIAYGVAHKNELTVVARVDLARFVFLDVSDPQALEAWSGEPVSTFLPPEHLPTPTSCSDAVDPLSNLPMQPLAQGKQGVFVWLLLDGTVLTLEPPGRLTAWRQGDRGLGAVLRRAGVPLDRALLFS